MKLFSNLQIINRSKTNIIFKYNFSFQNEQVYKSQTKHISILVSTENLGKNDILWPDTSNDYLTFSKRFNGKTEICGKFIMNI